VPWLVLGAFFQGVYFVLSQGSWYSTRTAWVAGATAIAAACNVLLNVVLIPRHGAIAAAWSTAAAYAVLAIVHGVLSRKLYPVRWRYERWLLMGGVGGALVAARYACAS
jgi:O-antigen/teichoic acid export membrane protein